MSLKIFAMTHKKYTVYNDSMYVPLQLGRDNHEDLGYMGDNTGDNISKLNPYYAELTGAYWVWKNCRNLDYVGVCHYRRYLVNEKEDILTEAEYCELLKQYDIIVSKKIKLNCTYYYGFTQNHHIKDLIETGRVIQEKYPQYYETFDRIVNSDETYFGNIMVTSKKLYDEYMEWLFDIFFEVQKRIDIASYDDYHKRVFGFISEVLLYVWITYNNLKPYECKVGIVGEKFETNETKKMLAAFMKNKDIGGAKSYFTECMKKRPDLMMEASDVNGELKLTMQVIATCDMEFDKTGRSLLDEIDELSALITYYRKLNCIVERYKFMRNTNEDAEYLREQNVSDTAVEIAVRIFSDDDNMYNNIISRMKENQFLKHIKEESHAKRFGVEK